MRIQILSILLPVAALCCLPARAENNTASHLADITTNNGRTYQNVSLVRVEPDGIVVNFQSEKDELGVAKLKFSNLPESLQKQYGYDPAKATAFEAEESQAMTQWRSQMASDEAFVHYRALAELNRSLAGEDLSTYFVTLDGNGKLSAQGFTGNVSPYTCCWVPALRVEGSGVGHPPMHPMVETGGSPKPAPPAPAGY